MSKSLRKVGLNGEDDQENDNKSKKQLVPIRLIVLNGVKGPKSPVRATFTKVIYNLSIKDKKL